MFIFLLFKHFCITGLNMNQAFTHSFTICLKYIYVTQRLYHHKQFLKPSADFLQVLTACFMEYDWTYWDGIIYAHEHNISGNSNSFTGPEYHCGP